MNGGFWKDIFSYMPPWFFGVAAFIILLALIVILIWISLGARRFADSMNKENRLIELQANVIEVQAKHKEQQDTSLLLKTAVENSKSYIKSLNDLRAMNDSQIITNHDQISYNCQQFIQRMLDSLSSDIKSRSGERHRCGLWFELDGGLMLAHGSTGFPEEYINNRRLDIDRSIAGKCFRKKETIKRDDVTKDDDWEESKNPSSNYTALICIPINTWSVLTIDALEPMKNEVVAIGELYAKIIEGAIDDMFKSFTYSSEATAATTDEY